MCNVHGPGCDLRRVYHAPNFTKGLSDNSYFPKRTLFPCSVCPFVKLNLPFFLNLFVLFFLAHYQVGELKSIYSGSTYWNYFYSSILLLISKGKENIEK